MSAYSPTQITLREQNQRLAKLARNKWFKIGIIAVISVCGLLYVAETNSLSTKGYAMSDLEKKVTELENQNRQLEAEIAQYQSMYSIKERLKEIKLVSVGTPEYIDAPSMVVARR